MSKITFSGEKADFPKKINYKIFEIEQPEDYKLKLINPDLMKPVFRCVLIGHSGSGKSQFINNVLFNNSFGYNKYFNEIYVFNGSLDDVDAMKQMQANFKMKNLSIQQKYNDEIVKDLFESIEKDNLKMLLQLNPHIFSQTPQ
jgi:excinuclease UvrABC ATPase subunit